MSGTCVLWTEMRVNLFENVSRNWNYEIHGTLRIKPEFIQPMYLLRETHFSCLLRFFTRSLFILTFLLPSGLDFCSFQVKMTCPVVIWVSKHVVFFVRKIAKSKKLSRRLLRKTPKEHHPEAAGHYYNSWESSGTLRCLTTWSNLLEWDSGLVIEEWLTRSDER